MGLRKRPPFFLVGSDKIFRDSEVGGELLATADVQDACVTAPAFRLIRISRQQPKPLKSRDVGTRR